MNNKGQSLITFVLILPIIVLFLAFVIDSGMMIVEKEHVDGILENNMRMAVEKKIKDVRKIEKVMEKNHSNLTLNVKIEDNILYINAKDNKKSLFGNIVNLSWYELDFNYCISYQNKELNKNCR